MEQIKWHHPQPVQLRRKIRLCLATQVCILPICSVELLVLNGNGMSHRTGPVLARERKRGPLAKLVLIIGDEIDLIVPLMEIDGEQFLAVVALAVNKRHKQST